MKHKASQDTKTERTTVAPRGWITLTLKDGRRWYVNATSISSVGSSERGNETIVEMGHGTEIVPKESITTVLAAIDAAQNCPL